MDANFKMRDFHSIGGWCWGKPFGKRHPCPRILSHHHSLVEIPFGPSPHSNTTFSPNKSPAIWPGLVWNGTEIIFGLDKTFKFCHPGVLKKTKKNPSIHFCHIPSRCCAYCFFLQGISCVMNLSQPNNKKNTYSKVVLFRCCFSHPKKVPTFCFGCVLWDCHKKSQAKKPKEYPKTTSASKPLLWLKTPKLLLSGKNPFERYARQIGSFPLSRDEHKKYSIWNHHLWKVGLFPL